MVNFVFERLVHVRGIFSVHHAHADVGEHRVAGVILYNDK